jgi:hypothetical protein
MHVQYTRESFDNKDKDPKRPTDFDGWATRNDATVNLPMYWPGPLNGLSDKPLKRLLWSQANPGSSNTWHTWQSIRSVF